MRVHFRSRYSSVVTLQLLTPLVCCLWVINLKVGVTVRICVIHGRIFRSGLDEVIFNAVSFSLCFSDVSWQWQTKSKHTDSSID